MEKRFRWTSFPMMSGTELASCGDSGSRSDVGGTFNFFTRKVSTGSSRIVSQCLEISNPLSAGSTAE